MRKQYRKTKQNYRNQRSSQRSSWAWLWLLMGMFVGVLIASTAYMFIIQKWSLKSLKPLPQLEAKKADIYQNGNPPSKEKEPTKRTAKETSERFEFYTLLPGMEVTLPDHNEHTQTAKAKGMVNPILTEQAASTPPAPEITSKNVPTSTVPNKSAKQNKDNKLKNNIHNNKALSSKSKTLETKKNERCKNAKAAMYIIQAGMFRDSKTADALKARLILQGFNTKVRKVINREGIWFKVTLGPYPNETLALRQKKRLAEQKINGILVLQRQQ